MLGAGLASILAVAPADAQNAPPPQSEFGDSSDFVHIVGIAQTDQDKLIVTLRIDDGFHINANPASLPYLIPTTLNITGATPLSVLYPRSRRFKPKFSDGAIDVYEGVVHIVAAFRPGVLTGEPPLAGSLTAQACTDEICFPPADLPLPGN